MCFTVNVNLVKEELEYRYGTGFEEHANHSPSYYYHAFSLPEIPVLYYNSGMKLTSMRWGLIPSWTADSEAAEAIRVKTFNARSESIDEKPSFSDSFASRRCIVPVAGFYEWQHMSAREKIPWFIYHNEASILSLAGIWDSWTDGESGLVTRSFSIVTTEANTLMAKIHNHGRRMPLWIGDDNIDRWLNPALTGPAISDLLAPYGDEVLKAHTIGKLINDKKKNKNSPDIIKPCDYHITGSLF